MSKGAGGLGWNSSEARGFSLKTIIRSEKKKEGEGRKKKTKQPPGPHFYANKEIGCVLFILQCRPHYYEFGALEEQLFRRLQFQSSPPCIYSLPSLFAAPLVLVFGQNEKQVRRR